MASNLNAFGGPITAIGDAATSTLASDAQITLTAASPSYQAIMTAVTGVTVIIRLPNTSPALNGRVFCITNLSSVIADSITMEVDDGSGGQLANSFVTGDGNTITAEQIVLAGDATSGRSAFFVCNGAAAGTAGSWVHMGSVLYSA